MIALLNGALAPSAMATAPQTVLVDGAKIVATGSPGSVHVPDGAVQIDCTGCTIIPGFRNSHVHFFERKWADAADLPAEELGRQLRDTYFRFGFTDVFDLSSMWENTRRLRHRIAERQVTGPRLRSTGEGMVPADPGLPAEAVMSFMGLMKTPLPEVSTPGAAATCARTLLDAGTDGIKLFVSSPSRAVIPEAAMRAAADVAHERGKPVFAHTNTAADVESALRAGVDVVTHTTPYAGPWPDEVLRRASGRWLTPTLTLWELFLRHDRVSTQQRLVETAVQQLRQWIDAGGRVLFGTDLGAVDPDPEAEYRLMRQAGMDVAAILHSLTTAPAEAFDGTPATAKIEPGATADLVVVEGDPYTSLDALRRVCYTLRAGRIVYRRNGEGS